METHELIENYRAALEALNKATAAVEAVNLPTLAAAEARRAAELKVTLAPNWPYQLDEKRVVVRHKGLIKDELTVVSTAPPARPSIKVMTVAADGTPVTPAPVPPVSTTAASIGATVGSITRLVLVVALTSWLFNGGFAALKKHIPLPDHLPNPFVHSVAYDAGLAYVKRIDTAIGGSFRQVAVDGKAGKPQADVMAAHLTRVKAALPWTPADKAKTLLDTLIPPGTATPTPEQQAAYWAAFDEFGKAWQSRGK